MCWRKDISCQAFFSGSPRYCTKVLSLYFSNNSFVREMTALLYILLTTPKYLSFLYYIIRNLLVFYENPYYFSQYSIIVWTHMLMLWHTFYGYSLRFLFTSHINTYCYKMQCNTIHINSLYDTADNSFLSVWSITDVPSNILRISDKKLIMVWWGKII